MQEVYSVRGPRRDERPPDVGPHSPWWPRYQEYADSCRRLSWLNTDCTHICHIAILGGYNWLPWQAAKICFEGQRDFNYLDERQLFSEAEVDDQGIRLAGMHYQLLITEHEPAQTSHPHWQSLEQAGRIIRYQPVTAVQTLIAQVDQLTPPDVQANPPARNLRVRHVVKDGRDYYLLFNEGKTPLETRLSLSAGGGLLFDPVSGEARPFTTNTPLLLNGYQLVVLL